MTEIAALAVGVALLTQCGSSETTVPGGPGGAGGTGGACTDCNGCTNGGEPKEEACNGVDDDCDGVIDDGLDGCGCTNGGQPKGEVCDGVDNDCDGAIDEENTYVSPAGECHDFGEPCVPEHHECKSQLCVGDDFEHYCTAPCDLADPDPPCTPSGYECWDNPDGDDYCKRKYAPCDREAVCEALNPPQTCTIQLTDDGKSLKTECRPPLPVVSGGELGDACDTGALDCKNEICHYTEHCSEVCHETSDCDDGWVCVMTWYDTFASHDFATLQYVSQCQRPCGDDGDCPGSIPACQPGPVSPKASGAGAGYCTLLYTGAKIGEPCDLTDAPPKLCDHSVCLADDPEKAGPGVCSEVCDDAADCDGSGWTCQSKPLDFTIGALPWEDVWTDICIPPGWPPK